MVSALQILKAGYREKRRDRKLTEHTVLIAAGKLREAEVTQVKKGYLHIKGIYDLEIARCLETIARKRIAMYRYMKKQNGGTNISRAGYIRAQDKIVEQQSIIYCQEENLEKLKVTLRKALANIGQELRNPVPRPQRQHQQQEQQQYEEIHLE